MRLMKEHRSFVYGLLRQMTEEQLSVLLVFTPDIGTVLKEMNPKKYFSGIKSGKDVSKLVKAANLVTKVVGISISADNSLHSG